MGLRIRLALAGAGAGAVAGLFGAGGGMVLVPLLGLLVRMDDQDVFPASVSIILPICLTSILVTSMSTGIAWRDALPYFPGSALGGYLAGRWGRRIPTVWLHRGLGALIVWGGIRYLC